MGPANDKNPKYDGKATFFTKPQVDIYSLGMILWELENNEEPFAKESDAILFKLLT